MTEFFKPTWGQIFKNLRLWWKDRRLKKGGQHRIVPYGTRGRTHVTDEQILGKAALAPTADAGSGGLAAVGKGEVTVSARIKRAGTDEWIDLGPLKES